LASGASGVVEVGRGGGHEAEGDDELQHLDDGENSNESKCHDVEGFIRRDKNYGANKSVLTQTGCLKM
jgi:hypothetical protein